MKKLLIVPCTLMLFVINAQATKHVITASGIQFTPSSVPNVLVGDTIRWVWANGSHTTTSTTIPSGAAAWNNPLTSSNAIFEYRVTVAGAYNYICLPHQSLGMVGTFTASQPSVNLCDTLVCDDSDACTDDDCDDSTGCFFEPADCDDLDICTNDFCINGGCNNIQINCDDSDACTDDFCDPLFGCFNLPANCDDGSLCTIDDCDAQSGCIYSPEICDDGDACTDDSCDSLTGCISTPNIICDDSDFCTDDACNAVTGLCEFTAITCDDADPCTNDACVNGVCNHSVIPGCIDPCDTLICDDSDLCTEDTCANGNCVFAQINDSTFEFLTSCNPADTGVIVQTFQNRFGCDSVHAIVTMLLPGDSTFEFATSCDPADTGIVVQNFINMFGCDSVHIAITTLLTCDDGNSCTVDSCGSFLGCTNTDTCSVDPCDTVVCDDGDACTTDGCINGNCVFAPVNCDDSDACTTDGCDALGGCAYAPVACDDGDSCTTDACDPLAGCTHTPIVPCHVGISGPSPVSANISVYPNPGQGIFTVAGTNLVIRKIRVRDISGKLLIDYGKLNVAGYFIEIQDLPTGVYVLQVETDKGEGIKKLLIQE